MKKILLIDDDSKELNLLESNLSKLEYKIYFAKNIEQARNLITKTKFNIIIIDVILGIENGYDAYAEFNESAEIVIISSNIYEETTPIILKNGNFSMAKQNLVKYITNLAK